MRTCQRVCIVLMLTGCRAPRTDLDAIVLEDQPVHLSSLVNGWRLFKGYEVTTEGPVVGTPAEAFLRLVAVRDGETRIVRTPSELQGIVRIGTEDEALAFVRLFTNYETHFLFECSLMEVSPTDSTNLGFAELPREEFNRLGLHQPRVWRSNTTFVIRRCVAGDNGGAKGTLYSVEEVVFPDGAYAATRTTLASDVCIFLPGFW